MMMKVPCAQGTRQAMALHRVARHGVSQRKTITLCVKQKFGGTSSKRFYPVGRSGTNKRK